LSGSSWTPERVERALALRAQGVTHEAIAAALGVAISTVGYLLRGIRAGTLPAMKGAPTVTPLAPRSLWWTPERQERALARNAQRVSYAAIALELGMTTNKIAGFLSRARERGEERGWRGEPEPASTLEDRLPKGPKANGCRYLTGEPREFGWCNKPIVGHGPYCAKHAARCGGRDA